MIYQWTGQPGHGKTLHALEQALEFKDAGRIVYACNVRKLDHEKSGLLPMTPDQFKDWMNFLPNGAVALVDECYEHEMLPKRAPGAKVPPHVEQLAKHRHRGIDFIFVCQSPSKQMDPFVHDLIEKHTHVRRRFGLKFAHLRIFDRYESRPEKAHPLILKRVALPKRPMGMYESTELDTTQKKVPWYYYAAAFLVVGITFGVWWSVRGVNKQFDPDKRHGVATANNGASATVGAGALGGEKSLGTPLDYAKLHLPRFDTMPWTAPVYDQRDVTVDPELFCMSSLGGQLADGDYREPSCSCFTEQGTPYDLPQPQCRTVARRGAPYNPYKQKKQLVDRAGVQGPAPAVTAAAPAAAPAVATMKAPQMATYGDIQVGTK